MYIERNRQLLSLSYECTASIKCLKDIVMKIKEHNFHKQIPDPAEAEVIGTFVQWIDAVDERLIGNYGNTFNQLKPKEHSYFGMSNLRKALSSIFETIYADSESPLNLPKDEIIDVFSILNKYLFPYHPPHIQTDQWDNYYPSTTVKLAKAVNYRTLNDIHLIIPFIPDEILNSLVNGTFDEKTVRDVCAFCYYKIDPIVIAEITNEIQHNNSDKSHSEAERDSTHQTIIKKFYQKIMDEIPEAEKDRVYQEVMTADHKTLEVDKIFAEWKGQEKMRKKYKEF